MILSKRLDIPNYTGPKKVADGLMFQYMDLERSKSTFKRLNEYRAAHLEYSQRVYDMCKGIPYEEMPVAGLAATLEVKGIFNSGPRENLIHRLRRCDAGKIQRPKLYKAVHFEAPVLKNNYSNELVGLPHFLLRHLFEYLDNEDLLQAELVCKVTHSLIYFVLDFWLFTNSDFSKVFFR